jgi:hypothetical protein
MPDPEFESTSGTVYLFPDRVKVLRHGSAGVLANHLEGVSTNKRVFFYAIAAAAAIATALISSLRGDHALSVVAGLFGLWMIHGLFTSRTPEGASVIMRDTIEAVEVHPPDGEEQPGYFIIRYREEGVEKSRRITLPLGVVERSLEYSRVAAMMRSLEEKDLQENDPEDSQLKDSQGGSVSGAS